MCPIAGEGPAASILESRVGHACWLQETGAGPFFLLLLLLSSTRGRAGVHDILSSVESVRCVPSTNNQGSCCTPIADDRRFEAVR